MVGVQLKLHSFVTLSVTAERGKRGKYVPVHAMKAYGGITGVAPLIRNLVTGWTCRLAHWEMTWLYTKYDVAL